jgi:YggT family protein
MGLIITLIDLYSIVILADVIMSWIPVDRRNPIAAALRSLTEPLLAPIRRALPPMAGLDLSPMVLLIALQFVKRVLLSA